MTYKEALDITICGMELSNYTDIVKEAIAKQIPLKSNNQHNLMDMLVGTCPVCSASNNSEYQYCYRCGQSNALDTDYCPNCGARMIEDK